MELVKKMRDENISDIELVILIGSTYYNEGLRRFAEWYKRFYK